MMKQGVYKRKKKDIRRGWSTHVLASTGKSIPLQGLLTNVTVKFSQLDWDTEVKYLVPFEILR